MKLQAKCQIFWFELQKSRYFILYFIFIYFIFIHFILIYFILFILFVKVLNVFIFGLKKRKKERKNRRIVKYRRINVRSKNELNYQKYQKIDRHSVEIKCNINILPVLITLQCQLQQFLLRQTEIDLVHSLHYVVGKSN